MRIIFSLLSLTLFALLVLDFSRPVSWPSSQSASAPENPVTDNAELEAEDEAAPRTAPPSHATIIEEEEAPAAQPEPEPEPRPAPASRTAQIEAEVLRLSNIERAKIGLDALAADATLAATARAHSADMIARDFFDHDNPDGCSSSCRATAAGYRWQMIGENIYMMSGWDLTAEEAAIMIVNGWLSSPGHKENLLKPGYEESGVGVVLEGDAVYATALYGKER